LRKIDPMELAEQTIWEGLRIYARAPGTAVIESDNVRAVCTGVPYEAFNAAIGSPLMRPEQIDRVMDLFRAADAPMLWHVWPPGERVESALLEQGLVFYEEEPAMVADLAVETPRASPVDVEIRRARDPDDLRAWVRILSGSTNERFIARVAELRAADRFEHLLGVVDGRMVATAAVFHGTRAAEIQHIATEPSHRRRGIGTAMTIAALELLRARAGSYAVLTASPDGARIYERLGFETVAIVRRFLGRPRRRGSRRAWRRPAAPG
jgi:ribosomal protein S18 acetylase RimI-like enzyme